MCLEQYTEVKFVKIIQIINSLFGPHCIFYKQAVFKMNNCRAESQWRHCIRRASTVKQVYRRRYESRPSSKPKLHFTKIKQGEKRLSIWRMQNSYNLQCGTITTLISSGDCTLQCDTWLWDDMPLNSPKRPPYWNSTSGFHFHASPQSTCHSVPVCEILSKSDHPRQKKMTVMSIFKMAYLSHLGLQGSNNGFFEKPS